MQFSTNLDSDDSISEFLRKLANTKIVTNRLAVLNEDDENDVAITDSSFCISEALVDQQFQ